MIIFALALAAAGPIDLNTKVDVNERTYRVRVQGRTVKVFPKAVFGKRNPEIKLEMKEAVHKATKCEIRDEYWEDTHLVGLIFCEGEKP